MSQRRRRLARPTRLAYASLIAVSVGCGGGEREPLDTADTAAMLSAELMDSARAAVLRGDSAAADSTIGDRAASGDARGDTAAVSGTRGVLAASTIVLRADSATGDTLFRRAGRCLTCHGQRGEGMPGLGPDLRDAEWLHGSGSVAEIRRIILDGIATPKAGRTIMPAFSSRLTEEQALRIAQYVYAISHSGVVVDSVEDPVN